MFNKILRIVANVVVSGGRALTAVGIKVFAVKTLFERLEIDNFPLLIGSQIVTILSSAYVYFFSSVMRTWRLTSRKANVTAEMSSSSRDGRGNRISALKPLPRYLGYSVMTLGVIGGAIEFSLLCYCGSNALLVYFGAENNEELNITNSIIGLLSGISAVYFAIPTAVHNLASVLRRLSGSSQAKIKICPAIASGALGTLNMLANIGSSNFAAKYALQLMVPGISAPVCNSLALTFTMWSIPICAQNKTMVLYSYIKNKEYKRICRTPVEGDIASRRRQRVLYRIHDVNGFIHLFLSGIFAYIGLTDLENNHLNWSSKSAPAIILNIICCMGETALDYAFTIKAMYTESKLGFFKARQSESSLLVNDDVVDGAGELDTISSDNERMDFDQRQAVVV